jgi:hypothetical protein
MFRRNLEEGSQRPTRPGTIDAGKSRITTATSAVGPLPPRAAPILIDVPPVIRDVAPQLLALLVAHPAALLLSLLTAESRLARPLGRGHHGTLGLLLLLLLLLLLTPAAASLMLRERGPRQGEREQHGERRE